MKLCFFENADLNDILSILTFISIVIGGGIGLYQWIKGNTYKKGEIMQSLLLKVRGDEDISSVLDIIDWDEDFYYDGKFYIHEETQRTHLMGITGDDLFKKIDKTLSHFSYICYLYSQNSLTKKEMKFFEYELRRLCDNIHIANYLFSLYHWSSSLNVNMSFSYLVDYCLKNNILDKSFKDYNSKKYYHYLCVSNDYMEYFNTK